MPKSATGKLNKAKKLRKVSGVLGKRSKQGGEKPKGSLKKRRNEGKQAGFWANRVSEKEKSPKEPEKSGGIKESKRDFGQKE